MKLAYIILAHKNAKQVYRLFERLNGADNTFVIHICKNSPKKFYREVKSLFKEKKNVIFCKREDGTLFGWGIVKGVINALRILIHKKIDFDYVNLISGQDYPIKSNNYIKDFLIKNNGKQFIFYFPMITKPSDEFHEKHPWGENRQMYRIDRYHIKFAGKQQSIPELETARLIIHSFWKTLKIFLYEMPMYIKKRKFKEELWLFILSRLLPGRRKLPDTFVHYGGSQWWSITEDCAKFILDRHDNDNRFSKFYKYTLLSDEMYFQTIIMNFENKFEVENNSLREIIWEGGDGTHPIFFNSSHFEQLQNSKNLFARKFEPDSEILNMIDKNIIDYN